MPTPGTPPPAPRGGVEPVAVVAPEDGNATAVPAAADRKPRPLERGNMNANQFKTMICKLREHVITDEGDFLPAGTPVQVAGWGGGDKRDPVAEDSGKVMVRSMAYMWCGEYSVNAIEECRYGGCVGTGLWLAVHPGNLVFSEIRTETKIGAQYSRA